LRKPSPIASHPATAAKAQHPRPTWFDGFRFANDGGGEGQLGGEPRHTHPDANELIMEYDPREQVHAAHVDGEQGQGVGGHEYAERMYVQVVGEHTEHAEHATPSQEVCGGEPSVPKVSDAFSKYVGGCLVVGAAQLTEEVQREE